MYQYTEAFCHYNNSSREILQKQKSSTLNFTYLREKIRKIWKIEKLREKNVEIVGKTLPDDRRAFFPYFPKFGYNWRYVSIYGGVLSPFVKFSRSIKINLVKFHTFWKKNQGNMKDRLKNCAKKMSKIWEKKSPMTLKIVYNRREDR